MLETTVIDGPGEPIVLLHGLGGSSRDWTHALPELSLTNRKIIMIDLLGFGNSPKPQWADYSVDEHAKALAATLRKDYKKPLTIVGYSMGGVVAARLAIMYPKQVKRLVLYELPLYESVVPSRRYRIANKAYVKFFKKMSEKRELTIQLVRLIGRVAAERLTLSLSEETWTAFKKSLDNTILENTLYDDLNKLKIPVDLIFGRFDFFVFQGMIKKLYKDNKNMNFHQVNETHTITKRSGKIIRSVIEKT